MVIDDEKSVHDITSLSLKEFTYDGRGLDFISAFSAEEAKHCLAEHPDTAVMLVDVVMETEDSGLKFVHYVREVLNNDIVQVVIRTGQPGSAPEDKVISKYRINSYLSKTEVTSQKLVNLVTTSLRTYQLALALNSELARRRRAEERLRDLNRDLEKKIQARTRELHRANQLKSQFLANMSHEIRTPMNGIIGMANLLMEEPLDQRQKEFASIIHSSGNTLLALINDILDLSKIEAGQLRFESLNFKMSDLLRDTLAMFRIKAEEIGLAMAAEVDPDLPEILCGDEIRIKQILVNLLSNALKFTEKGSVTIRLTLEEDLEDRVRLGLAVEDTGPGIAPDFKDHLFDKFSQQDTSTTRKFGGTGLGLAISKQLTKLMDGSIDAWNRPEGGAVFKVVLMLNKALEPVVSHREGKNGIREDAALREKIAQMDVRLLIAEDNPTNQKVICLMLKKLNIVPDVADNGQLALEMMRKNTYDLLIMDVQMPVLDGLRTSRMIRNGDTGIRQTDIPIVALTALAMQEDAAACKKAGMDLFLTKPVHPHGLVNAIAEALGV